MGLLLSVIPPVYRWAVVALLAVSLVGFGWVRGAGHVQEQWEAERGRQALLASQVAVKQAEATIKVVTKYVDRIKVVHDRAETIIKEVPIYVTKDADARCVVPRGFVFVHDHAATDTIPPAPSALDAAPSGVALSTIAGAVAENYGACHENARQLEALQEWFREMATSKQPLAASH